MKQSLSGLMDEAVDADMEARICTVIRESGYGALQVHDIRARPAGRMTFIEFHLVVPGTMSVDDSHAICDRIEAALKDDVEGAVVTIHVEPENKAKLHGGVPVV
jgi:divalent metal cation (Fe/Co/Zn/Cd) transporter